MVLARLTPVLTIKDVTMLSSPTSLATLKDGRVIAVYSGSERGPFDVRAQFLNAEGFAVGDNFSVFNQNFTTAKIASVTATSDGGYIVTADTLVQRFDAAGIARLPSFTVATGSLKTFELATLGDSLVVAAGQDHQVSLEIRDAGNAVARSTSFQTNGYQGQSGALSDTTDDVQVATYRTDNPATTRIVVAWHQHTSAGTDYVNLRVFDGNLNAVSDIINPSPDVMYAKQPDVTFLKDGSFVVAYLDSTQVGVSRYTANGESLGHIQANADTGSGGPPAISVLADGGYSIAWKSGSSGHIATFNPTGQLVNSDVTFATGYDGNASTDVSAFDTTVLASGEIMIASGLNYQLLLPDVNVFRGKLSISTQYGTEGSDIFFGGNNSDYFFGNGGRDIMYGGNGGDNLTGGAGSDVLIAGNIDTFRDRLDGGDGFDVVELEKPIDTYFKSRDQFGEVLYLPSEFTQGFASKDPYAVTLISIEGIYGTDKNGVTRALTIDEFARASFNPLAYIASYSDLIQSYGTNAFAGYYHYRNTAPLEHRTVTFDPIAYLTSNPDLAIAFGNDPFAGARHYITNGRFEVRPQAGFDALEYGASNPDLARFYGSDAERLTNHYLTIGAREGRDTSTFDPMMYGASNRDLALSFGNNQSALLNHYLTIGADQGRSTNSFDALAYAASSDDLARAFGSDTHAAAEHYTGTGVHEIRPLGGFDSVGYLLSNADLAGRTSQGALIHWLQNGADEGRTGDATFGREQGTDHAFAGSVANAAIETAGDHDWFELMLNGGTGVTIHLGGASSGRGTLGDGLLQLFDETGHLLATSHGAAGQSDVDLSFLPSATGRYFVVATGETDRDVGSYELSYAPFAAPAGALSSDAGFLFA